jgi:hypothetical protein
MCPYPNDLRERIVAAIDRKGRVFAGMDLVLVPHLADVDHIGPRVQQVRTRFSAYRARAFSGFRRNLLR